MMAPSWADAFQVLLLQLAGDGRGEALLGDSVTRARSACLPFYASEEFPSTYFEFPLAGEPFLDVTVLYDRLAPHTRIYSDAAAGTEPLLDWFADACGAYRKVCFGYELDTSKPNLPPAAIHFQPRDSTELVRPFFEAAGEPGRADLYLDLAARMPEGWPLSFFGMFRGRPGTPLRVCGYLDGREQAACAGNPAHLAGAFDAIGFAAYDDAMLAEVAAVMAASPEGVDFQFDVYPDGRLGDVFALDTRFGIERPDAVRATFETGMGAAYMGLLEQKGVADERWRLAPGAAFARSLPVVRADGTAGTILFALMPQWAKARWTAGVLQPAKLYCLANSSIRG